MLNVLDVEVIRGIVRDELSRAGVEAEDPTDALARDAVDNFFYVYDDMTQHYSVDDFKNLMHALITDVAEESCSICC